MAQYRIDDYRHHIKALAEAFHIDIVECPKFDERGVRARIDERVDLPYRFINRARIENICVESEWSYAVALHELGHILAPNGTAVGVTHEVSERAAWDWARYAALEWTGAMAAAEEYGMRSYIGDNSIVRRNLK